MRKRDVEHLLRRRHLEVERLVDLPRQPRDIVIGNMTAVLAQMRGNPVSAALNGDMRRTQRVRMAPTARIPDRRNVIDIDA